MDIASIRKDYQFQSLDITDAAASPILQFEKWWQEAISSSIEEVNAMTLATINEDGKPSARIVLLKGFDEQGFVFFTNYQILPSLLTSTLLPWTQNIWVSSQELRGKRKVLSKY